MGSKRIKWLDFAKGVAILVVVMCHAGFQSGANSPLFQIFENFLLIFAMPLFFAISGFLYKPSDNLRKFKILLYKKSASFIFPYLLFTIITLLLGMVSNCNILSNFYRIYAMPVEYLWFLYSLFIIFLIFGVMSLFHFKWYLQLSISIVLMISQIYLPWQYIKGDINPLSGIGSYMICFYIGHLMKRFHIVKKLRSSNSLFIVLSIAWIILIGIEFWITGVSYNTDLFNYPDIITKLLSIPVLFALFSKISKHKWFFRYFDKYGRYTLIIYLVHLPLIFVAGRLFSKYPIISNHKLLFIIYVIVGWFGSILMCYVSRKLKWIEYVFYPKKFINNIIRHLEATCDLLFNNRNFPNLGIYTIIVIIIPIIMLVYTHLGKFISNSHPYEFIIILVLVIAIIFVSEFFIDNLKRMSYIKMTNEIRNKIYKIYFRFISIFGIVFVGLIKLYGSKTTTGLIGIILIIYSSFLIIALFFSILFMNKSLIHLNESIHSRKQVKFRHK